MQTKIVNYDALAVLLLLEKEFEPTPEVFRCQPEVKFVIPFHEYIHFVELCLGRMDFLATPTQELHVFTREYRLGDKEEASKKLFSAFLKDMAFAVCKELYYAETSGKGATSIVHSVNTGVRLSAADIDSYYANGAVASAMTSMLQRLSCKGYAMPRQISAQNSNLFKYAVVMNFLATLPSFYWSYQ
jgi:hypothetical protein